MQIPTLDPDINDTMHKHKELFGKTWLSKTLLHNRYRYSGYYPTHIRLLVTRAKKEIANVEALNGKDKHHTTEDSKL